MIVVLYIIRILLFSQNAPIANPLPFNFGQLQK
jgi:hypothetical protein